MRQTIKRVWRNDFFQGGVFLTTSSIIISFLNYLFYFFSGRALGPEGYGEITAFLSYTSLLNSMIVVFSTLIIQKIGSNYINRYQYIQAMEGWFLEKLKKYLFLLVPVVLIIPFMPQITNLTPIAAYMILPFIFISVISTFYGSSLQGLRLFLWTSVVNTVAVLFKLTGALAVFAGVDGVATIILFMGLGGIICLTMNIKLLYKKIRKKTITSYFRFKKRILAVAANRQVVITALSVIAMAFFSNFDLMFVKKYFSATEAGIYSSWVLFAKIILYAVGPVMQVAFIFFATTNDEDKQRKTLKFLLSILTVVGLAGYFFYSYFAGFIINFFFGAGFNAVIPYLRYAAIFGSFFTAVNFINYFFLAKGAKQAVTLAVMVPFYVIGFFLIPKNLMAVINLNIGFSIVTAVVYLIVYFRTKRSLNS